LDLHESGIIGKPFKRTSTAICFSFFIFDLEYLNRLQSYEPLHAKMNPTSCLFGLRFAYLQAAILFTFVIFFAFFLLVDLSGLADFVSVKLFKHTGHPLFMFRLRNAALQTGLGRPRELLFLDLDFVLLASSRDPNFTGRHLFWLGLRVVGFLHTFYSRAVIQRLIVVSPAFMEYGLAKKIAT
jgi:hypothetical protein